ncbi:hypothetical protein ARMGADRAFT_1047809 [Armillaria gallica]|uniref:DNA breaking-rejoining enzyme n=1 Tax=Armillaria gallica TaxID=47427 RepID=A0A2H3CZ70_ARMGA|nr:hypothetical protein ARMGADRAFT_1047809 [Armillaria gallica]
MHGTSKGLKDIQRTFSHAMKLRAGTTFGFSTALGNPSISDLVSSYMLGLHKHKTAKGEASTSAQAISPDTLKRLYNHNHKPENWNNTQLSSGNWCGGNMRRLLQAVYLIAFTCLLCIDEVLNIQAHEVDLYKDDVDGTSCTSITLSFHKNAPFGALAIWIAASRINKGYLFPNINKHDRPITAKNTAMKSEVFLQLFWNNLWDLDITLYPYGTHSFCHGGCQWFSCDLCWSIRQICKWGGWSSDFSHLTIVKYLISSNDNLTIRCDEFFKLDHQVVKCLTCG